MPKIDEDTKKMNLNLTLLANFINEAQTQQNRPSDARCGEAQAALMALVGDFTRRDLKLEYQAKLLDTAHNVMAALRGVLTAVQRLRRFEGNESPVGAAMKGYLAVQDALELDAALLTAAQAVQTIEDKANKDGREYQAAIDSLG